MCQDKDDERLKFVGNWVANPASLYMDITLKKIEPGGILVRTREGGPTAAKIYPIFYIAEDGTMKDWVNNACAPNAHGKLGNGNLGEIRTGSVGALAGAWRRRLCPVPRCKQSALGAGASRSRAYAGGASVIDGARSTIGASYHAKPTS